jgi:hypothetical protein
MQFDRIPWSLDCPHLIGHKLLSCAKDKHRKKRYVSKEPLPISYVRQAALILPLERRCVLLILDDLVQFFDEILRLLVGDCISDQSFNS